MFSQLYISELSSRQTSDRFFLNPTKRMDGFFSQPYKTDYRPPTSSVPSSLGTNFAVLTSLPSFSFSCCFFKRSFSSFLFFSSFSPSTERIHQIPIPSMPPTRPWRLSSYPTTSLACHVVGACGEVEDEYSRGTWDGG